MAEANLAIVDVQHLHLKRVALFADIFHAVGTTVSQLGDMHQAVPVREDLNEGAKVGDSTYGAGVDLADLRLRGQAFDDLDRLLERRTIRRGHIDRTVILDIDADAGQVDDAFDRLSAGADDDANLLRLDLERDDTWCVRAHLFTRRGEGLRHLPEDVNTTSASLLQCLEHEIAAQALDLDVHLNGRDPIRGSTDLEVHVAEVVLVTQDIRKHRVTRAIGDETHGDARHRLLDGHACVHHRHAAATHRGHRRRAVALHRLAHDANRVREVVVVGDDAHQRSLGQGTVTDLATGRPAQELRLTRAVRREVVMQEEALVIFAVQAVDLLLVTSGAERRRRDGLGLAALKERTSVGTQKHACVRRDGADLVGFSPIDALLLGQNIAANHSGFARAELVLDQPRIRREDLLAELLFERLEHLFLQLVVASITGVLLANTGCLVEIRVDQLCHAARDGGIERRGLKVHLLFADGFP